MKVGKQREWSCQSHSAVGGKALRGLEGGLSHSVTLKHTPSCNFTPPVSEDSATGARLPEALQAENTGSITQRHMGSLCSALPGREIDSWCCRSRFLKEFESPNLSRGGDYYNVMMAI